MDNQTWARVSLTITSERLTAAEIGQLIAIESQAGERRMWAIDLTIDSEVSLHEQLAVARNFLSSNVAVLSRIAKDCDITLSIGWTPKSPQDGIVLDRDFIDLLSRMGGYVLLDTYLD